VTLSIRFPLEAHGRRRAAAAVLFALVAAWAAPALTLQEIRRGFNAAIDDPGARASLEAAIRKAWPRLEEAPVVMRAYAAALKGLDARQTRSLLDKVRSIDESIALFTGLVEAAPNDLETRFLRYAFYSELPALFRVSGFVPRDRSVLIGMLSLKDYSVVPMDMQRAMIDRMLSGAPMSPADRMRLQAIY
jgi:hypothetical protein